MTTSAVALRPVSSIPSSSTRPRRALPRAEDLGIVSQVKRAFSAKHRLAASIGLLAGGIVPVAIYDLCHVEGAAPTSDPITWIPWALALAGVVYSSHTVYSWAHLVHGHAVKAAAFAALLEGVMATSHTPWLRLTVLGYLVAINAISSACQLSLGRSADLAKAAAEA